ncbi:MAG: LysE family translocator [Anaerolineales bacterium]|nr:LysE family translocator [Anaerolineales bacterium]
MPEQLPILLRGLIIGFSIAAPVGPIGVLCIRRTLADGRLAGLVSGLGAACADAFYGSVAAFGLAAIANLLIGQHTWLRLVGGIFLCYLGIKTFFSRPAEGAATAGKRSLPGAFASTFVLTLTNPLTILSFAGIFAGLGLGQLRQGVEQALLMVAGVFSGSALWWLLLSGGVSLLRQKVTVGILQWINRLSGVVIAGFGMAALIGLIPTIS